MAGYTYYKYMTFLDYLIPAIKGEVVGCTAEEVELLEQKIGAKLPKAYVEFLRIAGKSTGSFFAAETVTYDRLDFLQRLGAAIALSSDPSILEKKPFFIFEHQAYSTVYFFLEPYQEDPPTYSMTEEDPEKENFAEYASFSNFMKDELIYHLAFSVSLNEMKITFIDRLSR
jgi:hypothetical protein